jgi:capsular polysaccharide export protein
MKIICIGYYDKFSRFFLGIKKELKTENPNLRFKIFSIYISGYLYSLFRLSPSSFISFKGWWNVFLNQKKYLRIIETNHSYKNIDFHNIIKFHTKLNENIKKKHLLLQAISYIDILHKEFINFKPDALLVIGDSRLLIEIAKKIATQFNTKIYFIEQGPFSSTFFDTKGVNYNASTKEIEINEPITLTEPQKKDILKYIERPSSLKYKRTIIYRGLDLVLERVLSATILYPPDLKYTDTFPKLKLSKNYKKKVLKQKTHTEKVFLIVLQVPIDVNMVFHSPHFKNHFSLVKKVHKSLPKNSKLILREHPIYKDKYEKELYEYCQKHDIPFDTDTSLKKSLNLSDVVIVNNSTVGIEAIAIKKTVIVLGNSYYDNPKLCIKYNQHDDLKKLLSHAINFKVNEENVYAFLQKFLFNYLIPGFITDNDLTATKTISNKILNEYNESRFNK